MTQNTFSATSIVYWDNNSRCKHSRILLSFYKLPQLRSLVVRLTLSKEGGPFFSQTLRDILRVYHGVQIGLYSYGGCTTPGYLPRGTSVGNYSSVSSYMRAYRRNHPTDRISQHPFFYNRHLGLLAQDSIPDVQENPLTIGHDVWMGHQVVITPNCSTIGDGAIIGAGSVITHDVEAFTIVAGNPAKVLKNRFPDDVASAIRQSQWWLRSISSLLKHAPAFVESVTLKTVTALHEAEMANLTNQTNPNKPTSIPHFPNENVQLPNQWECPETYARRSDSDA
jgi:virginiamycin A acetyltransferase